MFYAVRENVPEGFEGLFRNHLHRIDEALEPGLFKLRWTSADIPLFVSETLLVMNQINSHFDR